MKSFLACALMGFAAVAAPVLGRGAEAPVAVSISVLPEAAGRIGPGFCGLSYEKSVLASPLFSGGDAALIGLFRRLGSGVLRIGGNQVDRTHWDPSGPGGTPGEIAPADVDRLAAFARDTGWPVIYGVNLARSTPELAADEVACAVKDLGPSLMGIEIGNEPDLYSRGPFPDSWGFANYLERWRAFADAILRRTPGVPLVGPATANDLTWFSAFAITAPKEVRLLTHHYYRGDGRRRTSTVGMLVSWPDAKLAKTLRALRGAADTAHLPFRMGETNSFYHGGAPNVSDAYGSALWVIDDLFAFAEGGCQGANFHGGGNGTGYTPIADRGGVVVGPRAEYYGMYLFTQAGTGIVHACRIEAGRRNVSAYGVESGDGHLNVLVVNKTRDPLRVALAPGRPIRSATRVLLTGRVLSSPTGMAIDGERMQPDGALGGKPAAALPVAGATVACPLPPISAALIRLD